MSRMHSLVDFSSLVGDGLVLLFHFSIRLAGPARLGGKFDWMDCDDFEMRRAPVVSDARPKILHIKVYSDEDVDLWLPKFF